MNAIAVASLAAGVFVPSVLHPGMPAKETYAVVGGGFFFGFVFHWIAYKILGGLRE
jgi:hypothetical protein